MNNQSRPRGLPGETWLNYNDYYMLSNFGRWYSRRRNKIMKQQINNSGYNIIGFKINGKRKGIFTHIKVVELFGDKNGTRIPHWTESGLRELGLSIDHIDANKRNNTYHNLEVVTHIENCRRRDENKEPQFADVNLDDIF